MRNSSQYPFLHDLTRQYQRPSIDRPKGGSRCSRVAENLMDFVKMGLDSMCDAILVLVTVIWRHYI